MKFNKTSKTVWESESFVISLVEGEYLVRNEAIDRTLGLTKTLSRAKEICKYWAEVL